MNESNYNTNSLMAFDNGAFNETGCDFSTGPLYVDLFEQSIAFTNPVKEILEVSSNVSINSIKIINLSGVIVASAKSNRINTSNLSPGIYIARITNGESAINKKIIKR